MTYRRSAGSVVLGVALVLVAVLTGVHPHVVSGAGRAAPVPGPPVVGDCVVDPLPAQPLISVDVTATSGGTVPVYPAQQIQPCTTARYGEIVSVIAHPAPTVVEGDDANGRRLDDPNEDSCFPAAWAYVGMKSEPGGSWQTLLQFSTALARPSLRQQAAGQRWAVCIVSLRPPDPGPDPTTQTPAPPRYSSSIRDALHTGAQRDRLGTCIAALDWNGSLATDGCVQPHALEVMALGDSGDHPVARAAVQLSCEQLVRRLTAMTDPTAAGALAVQIYVYGLNGATVTTAQIPAHSGMECGIVTTGHRKLRGSLIALGRSPVPWTP